MVNLQFNANNDHYTAMTEKQLDAHIVGVIMAQQHGMKKGLQLFGDKVNVAVQKEIKQIHELETYEPILVSDLSWEDKKKYLESLLFITEKHNGNIKARKLADGSNQRTYNRYEKSDVSSPNVTTDSIFLTGLIDAHEGGAVAILDIANTFLQAHNDERVLVLLQGKLAEMMVSIDPSLYCNYVTYSAKGIPMMYVRLYKALHGVLRAALLF